MSLTLRFSKMHGAGNDFVMIDGRDLPENFLGPDNINALCDRRTGVGADGLIIVAPTTDSKTAFRMIYFNADGHEAEMCGNGARCSVAFARATGLAPEEMLFDTFSGVLSGTIFGPEDIQVSLPAWKDLSLNLDLGTQDFPDHHFCNTGVPHLVIPVPDVDEVDVCRWGSHYRHHELFAPAGTNVNFVSRDSANGRYKLRTFERGVEDETLACGTGASAAAVVMCQLGMAESPVTLHTRGGDELKISVDSENRELLLRGPAVTSFRGEVLING
jgi:diaminopimelate epimerase